MVALEWPDIDFKRGLLTVRRGEWEGEVISPKGGRSRVIPMSAALKKALNDIRHLRGEQVFFQRDGSPVDETTLRSWMERAQKQAGLGIDKGQTHILRHTFCSHLAMKNVSPRVIQELAGHADPTNDDALHAPGQGLEGGSRRRSPPADVIHGKTWRPLWRPSLRAEEGAQITTA